MMWQSLTAIGIVVVELLANWCLQSTILIAEGLSIGAMHSEMKSAKSLYDDGRLAVVHAVGYPNSNRSHLTRM